MAFGEGYKNFYISMSYQYPYFLSTFIWSRITKASGVIWIEFAPFFSCTFTLSQAQMLEFPVLQKVISCVLLPLISTGECIGSCLFKL